MAALAVVLMLAHAIWAQDGAEGSAGAAPVQIASDSLPEPVAHTPYDFQLRAQGGTPPYSWKLEKGSLPPGLHLDTKTGTITGIPESTGKVQFTIRVTDSGEPPQTAIREFTVAPSPALVLNWQRKPELENDGIYGDVEVANPSKDPYDLTFIIVAVNEIHKAFALGYQHFTLRPESKQLIPFGSSLPLGSYIVHADAVGEIAAKDAIRRAQLETPEPLVKK